MSANRQQVLQLAVGKSLVDSATLTCWLDRGFIEAGSFK